MYKIFDVSLESDLLLPELQESSAEDSVIEVSRGIEADKIKTSPDWFYEWLDTEGEISLQSAKIDGSYLLRFPELADFLISFQGNKLKETRVLYFPEGHIPDSTIRHLLIDQVIPRILSHKGELVLHASAVRFPEGEAVVFLGETGRGKSTLASSYHTEGAQIVTDDCLLIKFDGSKVFCVPNYNGLRLYPDSTRAMFGGVHQVRPVAHYTDKKRLVLEDIEVVEPIAIGAIFLLSDPEDVLEGGVFVEKIQGSEEVVSIVSQAFLLDTKDKATITRQFANILKLRTASPVFFRLNYPRNYEVLPEVRNIVNATLAVQSTPG